IVGGHRPPLQSLEIQVRCKAGRARRENLRKNRRNWGVTAWKPPLITSMRMLFVKLNRRLPEKQEVRRCDRNWSVDAEDGNLELVARLNRIGEYDPIRNVEALDRGRAGDAGPARHLPIDPDFRIIVNIGREYG